MQQYNSKKHIINPSNPSIDEIRELLTGNGIVELHFTGNTEQERLREVKHLYQITKKEYNRIGQDVFVRKTYRLKESSVAAFALYTEKHGIEQRTCISELMTRYADSVEKSLPVPAPTICDDVSEYKPHSYRILNSVVTRFHAACIQQQASARYVLQALIDNYILEKGE